MNQDIINDIQAKIDGANADISSLTANMATMQSAIDDDNANIATWTAQIATLQNPTVIAAISTVETSLQTAQNTAQPAQITP